MQTCCCDQGREEGGFKGPTAKISKTVLGFTCECTGLSLDVWVYLFQRVQGLKIATRQDQDAPLSVDVPREPCQGVASKKALKAPKEIQPTKQGLKRAMPLKIDAPLSTDVPREPCQGAASKKAPKSQKVPKEIQPKKQGLKIAAPAGLDAPLSLDVLQEPCQDASSKKDPAPKEIQPTKQDLKIATLLKIAMPQGQDAPLSADVPREQGQGATLKKAPKVPKKAQQTKKGLKIATPAGQDAPSSLDVPQEPCQDASSKKAPVPKAPMETQPTKHAGEMPGFICALKAQKSGQSKEVSGTAGTRPGAPKAPKAPKEYQQTKHVVLCPGLSVSTRVQKSGQAKKLSGTAGSEPPKTKVNKRKAKADVKEREGTAVPEQHNVKRLKSMKEVGVRESIERKLAIDEVKVKGHTDKGQLEKVSEVKIALKRDGMKAKAKKPVEKGQEYKTPYVEIINGGKLVKICRAEPPCASRNTLMEKRSRMIQHLKKVHGLDVFIPQRFGERPRGSVNNDVPKSSIRDQHRIKVGTLIAEGDDKSSGGSSGGSDDDGDEDDESSQDGGGDDDSDDGSDGDADDDDGGSDISGGGDDETDGEDDGTDDEDDGGGSGKGDNESVSEQDDVQDVSSDEDEVQEILSSPASILA
ncbi:hypothetical protein L7F22_033676 [Adiantum nelumboides]|nr:hypothetical protein [Adiantum nelumboides]